MCTKACGLDDVFPPGLVWMLGINSVVCNKLLFLHSFNELKFDIYLLFQHNFSVCTQ